MLIEIAFITAGDPPLVSTLGVGSEGRIQYLRVGRKLVHARLSREDWEQVRRQTEDLVKSLPPSIEPPGSWHAARLHISAQGATHVYTLHEAPEGLLGYLTMLDRVFSHTLPREYRHLPLASR